MGLSQCELGTIKAFIVLAVFCPFPFAIPYFGALLSSASLQSSRKDTDGNLTPTGHHTPSYPWQEGKDLLQVICEFAFVSFLVTLNFCSLRPSLGHRIQIFEMSRWLDLEMLGGGCL